MSAPRHIVKKDAATIHSRPGGVLHALDFHSVITLLQAAHCVRSSANPAGDITHGTQGDMLALLGAFPGACTGAKVPSNVVSRIDAQLDGYVSGSKRETAAQWTAFQAEVAKITDASKQTIIAKHYQDGLKGFFKLALIEKGKTHAWTLVRPDASSAMRVTDVSGYFGIGKSGKVTITAGQHAAIFLSIDVPAAATAGDIDALAMVAITGLVDIAASIVSNRAAFGGHV